MRRPRWILALLIVPLLLLPGCKKAEDPETTEIVVDPGGPPGPIIIIKPPTGGSGALTWSMDTDLSGSADKVLTAGPSITDPSDTANYCRLREDFIGEAMLELSMDIKGGGQIASADDLSLAGTDYAVHITRKSNDIIKWQVYAKVSEELTLKCNGLTAIEDGGYDEDEMPFEFTQLTDIQHFDPDHAGDQVELQVQMPKETP